MNFFSFCLMQTFFADAMMLSYKREGLGDFMSSWQARVGKIIRKKSVGASLSQSEAVFFRASESQAR